MTQTIQIVEHTCSHLLWRHEDGRYSGEGDRPITHCPCCGGVLADAYLRDARSKRRLIQDEEESR